MPATVDHDAFVSYVTVAGPCLQTNAMTAGDLSALACFK